MVPVGKQSSDKAQMDEVVREMAKLRIDNLELNKKVSDMSRIGYQGAGGFGQPINPVMPSPGRGYEF